MSIADVKYKELLKDILENGVWDTGETIRAHYADGTPAHSKSVFGKQVKFEQGEVPIITCKHVPVVSSINEVVHLFFRLQSNSIHDARELGIKYWDSWALEDGTIGKSYSYQLKHQKEAVQHNGETLWLNQVDSILHKLKHDPMSRRIMFSYWKPEDVHKKSLQECAWSGLFNVRDGKLDFLLTQRSVDTFLGLPTNWAGYYALQCAIANVTGHEVGTFTHQMGNVHLYDNQIELAKELIDSPEYDQPTLWVNPAVESFYDYTTDDIKVKDYKRGERVRVEVAI